MKTLDIYNLRQAPELTIKLNDERFEVIDFYDRKNIGVYSFENLQCIKINAERANWMISTLSWIVDLFTVSGDGGLYKDQANMVFKMSDMILKISLIDADYKKAESLVEFIKTKFPHD